MPIVIKCKNCGEVFYIGYSLIDLSKFIGSLEECRRCGRKLDISKDIKLVIRLIEEKRSED